LSWPALVVTSIILAYMMVLLKFYFDVEDWGRLGGAETTIRAHSDQYGKCCRHESVVR